MQFWDNIFSPRGKKYVDEDEVLTKVNTTEYTPTTDYHPATKKYVDDKSLEQNSTPIEFEEATERVNINSGETLSTLFGKIKKWFTDLKDIAFTASWNDLEDIPQQLLVSDDPSETVEDAKLNADTLDGHSAGYFATQSDLNGVNTTINQVLQNISTIEGSITDIDGSIVTINQNINDIESDITNLENKFNDTFDSSGILPINKGGTNATTANDARVNLDAYQRRMVYISSAVAATYDINNTIFDGILISMNSTSVAATNLSSIISGTFVYIHQFFYNVVNLSYNRFQVAHGYNSNNMATRYYYDGTWSDWQEIGGSSTNIINDDSTTAQYKLGVDNGLLYIEQVE